MNNRSMLTVLSLIAMLNMPGNAWGMKFKPIEEPASPLPKSISTTAQEIGDKATSMNIPYSDAKHITPYTNAIEKYQKAIQTMYNPQATESTIRKAEANKIKAKQEIQILASENSFLIRATPPILREDLGLNRLPSVEVLKAEKEINTQKDLVKKKQENIFKLEGQLTKLTETKTPAFPADPDYQRTVPDPFKGYEGEKHRQIEVQLYLSSHTDQRIYKISEALQSNKLELAKLTKSLEASLEKRNALTQESTITKQANTAAPSTTSPRFFTTEKKMGLMAAATLLIAAIVGGVLFAAGALDVDKNTISFKEQTVTESETIAAMVLNDATLPSNQDLDTAIDNTTCHPLIIAISENQWFGRTLTDQEMTDYSLLVRRQEKSSEMLSTLLTELGTRGGDLSLQEKAMIKKLEKLHNDSQKTFYLKELFIRYTLNRESLDDNLSARYDAITKQLTRRQQEIAHLSSLGTDDESRSEAYKAFLMAQTNNLQSELLYVSARTKLEIEATNLLRKLATDEILTPEEKAQNFDSQYQQMRIHFEADLLTDESISLRNEAEPYTSSRNRTSAIFEGKVELVPFIFQEPIPEETADPTVQKDSQPTTETPVMEPVN